MRTIISGPATRDTLDSADLISGITPSAIVTNGATPDLGLPVTVFKVDPKLGSLGEDARDYTLVQNADALVLVGDNDHLLKLAQEYGLAVYQE